MNGSASQKTSAKGNLLVNLCKVEFGFVPVVGSFFLEGLVFETSEPRGVFQGIYSMVCMCYK